MYIELRKKSEESLMIKAKEMKIVRYRQTKTERLELDRAGCNERCMSYLIYQSR